MGSSLKNNDNEKMSLYCRLMLGSIDLSIVIKSELQAALPLEPDGECTDRLAGLRNSHPGLENTDMRPRHALYASSL